MNKQYSADDKRVKLREALSASTPTVAVGAHDGLSAQLVEAYGFDAVWVSGFGVSTMNYALPDLNLMTMTEALAVASRIESVTNLPVIADCDNGFGGLCNLVRTVKEYERAGISGICVEDSSFPKRNSLYEGDCARKLVPVDEQVRRIRAAKLAQMTQSFVFVARIEALIAGRSIDEACERADAYATAGADAILIHSRDSTLTEIENFLSRWHGIGRVPLIAVPTLFPTFTIGQLFDKGFQMVILANQLMRAAVRAMEDTLHMLKITKSASSVESSIATVDHILDIMRTREFIELEEM